MPTGVPSSAVHISGWPFTVPANGAGASADVTTTIVINNTSGGLVVISGYIVLDGNLADALPMVWNQYTTRQDFSSAFLGLAAGPHNVDVYINTVTAGIYCLWVCTKGPMFFA